MSNKVVEFILISGALLTISLEYHVMPLKLLLLLACFARLSLSLTNLQAPRPPYIGLGTLCDLHPSWQRGGEFFQQIILTSSSFPGDRPASFSSGACSSLFENLH